MILPLNLNKFDTQRLYLVQHSINKVRESNRFEILGEIDKQFGRLPPQHILTRTVDNDRIVLEILSNIFVDNNGDYKEANRAFLLINSEQMEKIILHTIQNMIGLDYYYTQEKEW